MNYLLHRQKTYRQEMKMPEGITELMADISREVLRKNPSSDCLYKFIADYLDALLTTREKCRVVDDVIEEALDKTKCAINDLRAFGIPVEKAESCASIMRESFRTFVDKKRTKRGNLKEFGAEDLIDELIKRCSLSNEEVMHCRPIIECAYKKFIRDYSAAIKGKATKYMLKTPLLKGTIEQRLSLIPTEQELNWAATKIQSTFRGFTARKKNVNCQYDTSDLGHIDSSDAKAMKELEQAAIKIQSAYRGFSVREHLHEDKSMVAENSKMGNMVRSSTESEQLAAIRIQAVFRGYNERKHLQEHVKELTDAAVKIQSNYRGYITRRHMSSVEALQGNSENLDHSNINEVDTVLSNNHEEHTLSSHNVKNRRH